MPVSYKSGKKEARLWIESQISSPDFVVLDLGCGLGTYGKLITVPCIKYGVDAVDYSKEGEWDKNYKQVFVTNILETDSYFLKIPEGKVDLAILGDVLEHLFVSDAQALLAMLMQNCNSILIAVPYMYPQGSRNPYEVHRQPDLTPENFLTRYPGFTLLHRIDKKDGSPKYGYYIWKK